MFIHDTTHSDTCLYHSFPLVMYRQIQCVVLPFNVTIGTYQIVTNSYQFVDFGLIIRPLVRIAVVTCNKLRTIEHVSLEKFSIKPRKIQRNIAFTAFKLPHKINSIFCDTLCTFPSQQIILKVRATQIK